MPISHTQEFNARKRQVLRACVRSTLSCAFPCCCLWVGGLLSGWVGSCHGSTDDVRRLTHEGGGCRAPTPPAQPNGRLAEDDPDPRPPRCAVVRSRTLGRQADPRPQSQPHNHPPSRSNNFDHYFRELNRTFEFTPQGGSRTLPPQSSPHNTQGHCIKVSTLPVFVSVSMEPTETLETLEKVYSQFFLAFLRPPPRAS